MTKIVLNRGHGGFSLSAEAILFLIQKDSEVIQAFSIEDEYDVREQQLATEIVQKQFVPFQDGYLTNIYNGNLYKEGKVYRLVTAHENGLEIRDNPDIVQVVEALGDKSSGKFAVMEVVEVPDDVEWEVMIPFDVKVEYIREQSRSWYGQCTD